MILCVSKINVNKAWIQSKIHAEPACQTSFAKQWCRMPTWHGIWRHRETSYSQALSWVNRGGEQKCPGFETAAEEIRFWMRARSIESRAFYCWATLLHNLNLVATVNITNKWHVFLHRTNCYPVVCLCPFKKSVSMLSSRLTLWKPPSMLNVNFLSPFQGQNSPRR